ncbi:MAG: hypothetical protein J1F11_10270 [Oscillospiraceae bacterium]|nr:hypothetical protein [Oscillospiraceae bacterium]
MIGFDAYFYECKFFINSKKGFTLGEILTKYLSKDFKSLNDTLRKCRQYVVDLHYPEDKAEVRVSNNFFQGAITFYCTLDDMICSLPPYSSMDLRKNRLYDLLNEYFWLWQPEEDENGNELDYVERFDTDTPLCDHDRADLIDGILEFNEKLKAFAMEYAVFIEDLLRVKKVYEPFLEKLHSQSRYLDNSETAKVVEEFMTGTKSRLETFEKLKPSGNMQLTYTVLDQKKSPILCETYHFDTIGAFLYIELFKGLEQHYLPKKCGYCGRYFLLEAGIYSDYCTRPVKNTDKTCRDLGHRKKYADKVKNNPVWLTYSRAYKQHYARYLKKKMSQAEFQKWADYALELRQQALDGTLDLEEYQKIIRE